MSPSGIIPLRSSPFRAIMTALYIQGMRRHPWMPSCGIDEIPQEGIQGWRRIPCIYKAVMIARNGEDRSGIIPEGLIELVVIIHRLPEAVYYVSQVRSEERRVGK